MSDPNYISIWAMPEFASLDEGPFSSWFRVPCPGWGINATCEGWAQAYKIAFRSSGLGVASSLQSIPDSASGSIRQGHRSWDHVGRCQKCKGFALDLGQATALAELERVRDFERHAEQQRLLEASGIPLRYQGLSLWERCHRRLDHPSHPVEGETYLVGRAAAAFALWARNDDYTESAILFGSVGGGKTHLAMAHACNRLRLGRSVLVLQERAIQSHLQAGMQSEEYRGARQRLEHAASVSWLLWDDLAYSPEGAKDRLPDRLIRELEYLCNARYEAKLPTLFTSNCDSLLLEHRIGVAFASRIRQMVGGNSFGFGGPDWRRQGRSTGLTVETASFARGDDG